jgi:hypothetical protein
MNDSNMGDKRCSSDTEAKVTETSCDKDGKYLQFTWLGSCNGDAIFVIKNCPIPPDFQNEAYIERYTYKNSLCINLFSNSTTMTKEKCGSSYCLHCTYNTSVYGGSFMNCANTRYVPSILDSSY